jgi:hypothetical protein
MELQKVALKVPVVGDVSVDQIQTSFVNWIRDDRLNGTLVDVADYSHMHEGPTVILVAHEFILSLDDQDGVKGLKISYRLPSDASLVSRVSDAWKTLSKAITNLKEDIGLSVDTSSIEVTALDRLNASEASVLQLSEALTSSFSGIEFSVTGERDARQLPGASFTASPALALI